MICGYEAGHSKIDQKNEEKGIIKSFDLDAGCTFANKELCYGADAKLWPYDRNIIHWFELWGHPLNRRNPGKFEKSIVQTNWSITQNQKIDNDGYKNIFTENTIKDFISLIEYFKPRILLLMGARLIHVLQNREIHSRFVDIMGECIKGPLAIQKEFPGRRFRVWFQSFDQCEVVCLPHPSGSRGLSPRYMELFKSEIGGLLTEYKIESNISP